VAQIASCIGRDFEYRLLAAIADLPETLASEPARLSPRSKDLLIAPPTWPRPVLMDQISR